METGYIYEFKKFLFAHVTEPHKEADWWKKVNTATSGKRRFCSDLTLFGRGGVLCALRL